MPETFVTDGKPLIEVLTDDEKAAVLIDMARRGMVSPEKAMEAIESGKSYRVSGENVKNVTFNGSAIAPVPASADVCAGVSFEMSPLLFATINTIITLAYPDGAFHMVRLPPSPRVNDYKVIINKTAKDVLVCNSRDGVPFKLPALQVMQVRPILYAGVLEWSSLLVGAVDESPVKAEPLKTKPLPAGQRRIVLDD